MARRSVGLNHLESKIEIVTGDVKGASSYFGASSFHVITTNPPYMIGNHGLQNAQDAKTIARHEVLCTLDFTGKRQDASAKGKVLYGAPSVPPFGNFLQNDWLWHRAEADEACASIC